MRRSKLKIDLDSTCKELKFFTHFRVTDKYSSHKHLATGFYFYSTRDLPPAFPARRTPRHPRGAEAGTRPPADYWVILVCNCLTSASVGVLG